MTKPKPKKRILPAAGFRDQGPQHAHFRHLTINLIAMTFEKHGFCRIDTPIVETLENLKGSGGEENEKLIFKLLKRGESLEKAKETHDSNQLSDLGLRYDLTVPLARFTSRFLREQGHEFPLPYKFYQIGPVYRAERQQKGRFREFYQADMDILGAKDHAAEIELLSTAASVLEDMELNDLTLRLNDRRILDAVFIDLGCTTPEAKTKIAILLDKRDKLSPESFNEQFSEQFGEKALDRLKVYADPELLPGILDELAPGPSKQIRQIAQAIGEKTDIFSKIHLDIMLVRGMSYYTGAIFEINHPGINSSIAGGGRYDNLMEQWSHETVPACGLSLGLERLMLLDEDEAPISPFLNTLFIAINDESLRKIADQLAKKIRNQDINVSFYPGFDLSLSEQMRYAQRWEYIWVLPLTAKSLKTGSYELRNFVEDLRYEVDELSLIEKIRQYGDGELDEDSQD